MVVRKKNIFNYFPFKLILLAISIVLVSFLGGIKFNEEKSSSETNNNQTENAIRSKCDSTECLFNSDWDQTLQGYGEIIGYYQSFETTAGYGSDEIVKCDAFVPAYGNQELIDSLKINARYDGEKNLLVNIDVENLDASEAQKIKSSDYNSLVKLKVIKTAPTYRDTSACESSLHILTAENWQ